MTPIRRVASFKTAEEFRARLDELSVELPFDDEVASGSSSPLVEPIERGGLKAGNRWAVLPMEGWDGTEDGQPSDLTRRRWGRFGQSGAKLIWGGEAVAVRHDGRANPNQLVMSEANVASIADLREHFVSEHRSAFGADDGLLIGLQLTHSGRFSRPNDKKRLEPTIAYRHPVLDRRVGAPPELEPISDDGIRRLIDDFVSAAKLTKQAGFSFIDVKHCHGYFGHELLSAYDRPGPFGGSLENRTRFLREIIAGVRAEAPGLAVGVRLSAFDFVPFRPGPDGVGVPDGLDEGKRFAFGGDGTGLGVDLFETKQLLQAFVEMGIYWVCVSAGNPYANPHILRPAAFPPSDGYLPPEDPLVGVARQINVVKKLKAAFPQLVLVGSGYTYLQDWLPNVAQAAVRTGIVDVVGVGRMVLSYPEMPADVLAGRPLDRKRLCRTFSDCTSGPRNGLISGCFPLDPFYKNHPEHVRLAEAKRSRS
jgi:NADPH2 dehydrogenase